MAMKADMTAITENLTRDVLTMNSCLRPSMVVAGFSQLVSRSAPGEPQHSDTTEDIAWGACAALAAMVLASLLYHLIWSRKTRQRERESQRASQQDELTRSLVMHFAPLVAVDSYQFKGMHGTKCGVSLEFEKLGLTLKGSGRRVLDGVTGSFDKGKMIAIMGPSGSGKTTFMNVLCGKATYGHMTGIVRVNGEEGKLTDLKPIMGFVPQDDIVHERLTVREQLEKHAKLRNDYRTTREELKNIVEDVLHVLQIEHIQRVIVGGVEQRGISGGQRKRVNIGLELAACPALLFLDEPTSGLDSTSSLMVVSSMKKMTSLGMTIIMVIHQPRYSLFALFDQVLLLGSGGHTVYSGSASKAISYFEGLGFDRPVAENPADWMMDVISGQVKNAKVPESKPRDLFDRWQETSVENKERLASPGTYDGDPMVRARTELVQNHSHLVGMQLVSQEWAEADSKNLGYLTLSGFTQLVEHCCNVEPDKRVVTELMGRIASESSSWHRRVGSVIAPETFGQRLKKEDFAEFLRISCEDIVAGHRIMHRRGSSRLIHGDDEDSFAGEDDSLMAGLERRVCPGPCRQWTTMSHARMIQFWRNWRRRLIDNFMIVFCATAFAMIGRGQQGSLLEVSMYQTGLALLIPVSVLPTFADRPIFWRQSSSGMSICAYYVSRITVSLIDAVMLSIIYAIVYWSVSSPDVPFTIYLAPGLCLAWSVSACGYFLSVVVPRDSATLVCLVVMLANCQVLGKFDLVLSKISSRNYMWTLPLLFVPTRWSNEMQFVAFTEYKGGVEQPVLPNCTDIEDPSMSAVTADCFPVLQNCSEHLTSQLAGQMLSQQGESSSSSMDWSLVSECEYNFESCIAGHYKSKNTKRVFSRLSDYFREAGFAQYLSWAYYVYTNDGMCERYIMRYGAAIFRNWETCHYFLPSVILFIEGLLLHALALVCLAHQKPDAKPFLELCCCCCFRRRVGDQGKEAGDGLEDDTELSTDSDEDENQDDESGAWQAASPVLTTTSSPSPTALAHAAIVSAGSFRSPTQHASALSVGTGSGRSSPLMAQIPGSPQQQAGRLNVVPANSMASPVRVPSMRATSERSSPGMRLSQAPPPMVSVAFPTAASPPQHMQNSGVRRAQATPVPPELMQYLSH